MIKKKEDSGIINEHKIIANDRSMHKQYVYFLGILGIPLDSDNEDVYYRYRTNNYSPDTAFEHAVWDAADKAKTSCLLVIMAIKLSAFYVYINTELPWFKSNVVLVCMTLLMIGVTFMMTKDAIIFDDGTLMLFSIVAILSVFSTIEWWGKLWLSGIIPKLNLKRILTVYLAITLIYAIALLR